MLLPFNKHYYYYKYIYFNIYGSSGHAVIQDSNTEPTCGHTLQIIYKHYSLHSGDIVCVSFMFRVNNDSFRGRLVKLSWIFSVFSLEQL